MKIQSKDIKMVDVEAIVPNPKNANRHSIEQIERLTKLIKYQGFRNPLIVSNRTGFLVVGHGRLEAAKNLDMKEVPVIYQDFENEAQEYSYLISDNEIARWAELDKQSVFDEIEKMPELNIDLLAIEDFSIEKEEEKKDKPVELSFDYKIEVDCKDEDQQQYLMGELQDRGFEVRVLL